MAKSIGCNIDEGAELIGVSIAKEAIVELLDFIPFIDTQSIEGFFEVVEYVDIGGLIQRCGGVEGIECFFDLIDGVVEVKNEGVGFSHFVVTAVEPG